MDTENVAVLVVEDDAVIGLELVYALREFGFEVIDRCTSAARARELCAVRPPEVVLLDIDLRGQGDGIELAHELIARHAVGVLFVTGYSDAATLARAAAVGAAGFLLKPVELSLLRATVVLSAHRARLDRSRRAAERQAQAAQVLTLVAQTSAALAHDLNNLITVVLAAAQLVTIPGLRPDELRGVAEDLGAAGRHGAALVHRLLHASRTVTYRPQPTELNAALRGARSVLARVLRPDTPLTLEVHPEAVWVEIDPVGLDQVLLNLVLNASQASEGGGRVQLRVEGDTEEARVSVTDEGCGLPPELLAALLDPALEPGQERPARPGGLGLGLASVRAVARAHMGQLTARSIPGQGSVFTVHLPRLLGSEAPRAAPAPALPQAAQRGRDVLVALNDAPLARMVARALREAGHTVTVAESPGAALDLGAALPQLDVLVVDHGLALLGPEGLYRPLRGIFPRLARLVVGPGGVREVDLPVPFDPGQLLAQLGALDGAAAPGASARV